MEFKRNTRSPGGQPDLAPMIDVIFHLLIFFMAFSVLYQTTMSIDVELPKAVSGSDVRNERFEISVTKDGLFSVSRKVVTPAELEQALREALAVNPDLLVLIKGDHRATVEQFVGAMDIVAKVGVSNIHVGTQEP
ncbi:MAG TPA: biopolymer transporter ExbD [Firmicutes bacterium]|nr:biopolymer transporter ExbD [Bacillota bacterium]